MTRIFARRVRWIYEVHWMSQKSIAVIVPLAEVPSPNPTEKNRPVVLIVDDERVIADTLAVILSKNGFAAMTAYDGKSALEIAGVIPPELLLSDVVMPEMTGIELAIAVVQNVPDCKVLLFSGQAATVDLLAQAHAAGRDFTTLKKPVHPTDLLACITDCMETQQPASDRAPAKRDKKEGAEVDDANFEFWRKNSFL
jgi:DNA-binding NtrC family response regulator